MIRNAFAALFAVALMAAPANAQDSHGHADGKEDQSHHEGEANGVRAVHAWTRATSESTTLVFVEIENKSDRNVSIVGGHAEWAEKAELVGFQLKDGEPDYVALPAVPVKAGTEMTLAPNGLALRFEGLKMPMEKGSEHEIEIEFDFGHIEMHMQVEDAGANNHSHVGHQH